MRLVLGVICGLILFSLTGCTEDTSNDPRFEDIWPHDDGLVWLFDYTVETYPDFSYHTVDKLADIPHLPPMSVLAAYLESTIPEPGYPEYAYYELVFDGLITTKSGVEGQRLVESIYELGFTYPVNPAPNPKSGGRNSLLKSLAAARPDLREAIHKDYPQIEASPAHGTVLPPVLIAGGAWEQTSLWIGDYADEDQELAWKYLSSDLKPGSSFRHQLVPSRADDVFLDVLILDWIDFKTPIGTFENCVKALYRIDYGVTEDILSETYFRGMGYGVIIYAPDVGPVYILERDRCNLLDPFDCAREIESMIVSQYLR